MHIAILVYKTEHNQFLPGSIALKECAESMGHKVTLLNELDIQVRFGLKPSLLYLEKPFPNFDVILTRPLFKKDPSVYTTLIHQFELEGFLVMNDAKGIQNARNKIKTLQILSDNMLPVPKTVIISSSEQLDCVMKNFKFPVIIKAPYGIGGKETFIAESLRALRPLVEFLLKELPTKDPIQVQEYIEESHGKDLRLFVVGKKVVATMQRSAKEGDFRSNLHRGGTCKVMKPTKKEIELALEAVRVVGLDIAGVDILRTKSGPMIIEINSTPGFEGIKLATGIDVAYEIIEYVEITVQQLHQK